MPGTFLMFGAQVNFSLNPCAFMNSSRSRMPWFEQIAERIGYPLNSAKGPPKSFSIRPRPDPSCPSFMVSSARMFSMGEKYSADVIALKRHMLLLLFLQPG